MNGEPVRAAPIIDVCPPDDDRPAMRIRARPGDLGLRLIELLPSGCLVRIAQNLPDRERAMVPANFRELPVQEMRRILNEILDAAVIPG